MFGINPRKQEFGIRCVVIIVVGTQLEVILDGLIWTVDHRFNLGVQAPFLPTHVISRVLLHVFLQ